MLTCLEILKDELRPLLSWLAHIASDFFLEHIEGEWLRAKETNKQHLPPDVG